MSNAVTLNDKTYSGIRNKIKELREMGYEPLGGIVEARKTIESGWAKGYLDFDLTQTMVKSEKVK